MTVRVVTAIVGIPVVVGLTWLGGWAFAAMILAISVVAQAELYTIGRNRLPRWGLLAALGAGAAASLFATGPVSWVVALVLLLVALVAVPLSGKVDDALPTAALTVLGVAYPPVLLGTLVAVRSSVEEAPFWVTLGIIVLVWAADTGAYYSGRSLGRHALAPVVSPKKTWEGFAGGIAAAVAAGAVWSLLTGSGTGVMDWIALALIAGVLGPMGDLFESSLKRSAGVKDSGTWLPGHGGLLDRFDALAFVAPAAWLYLTYVA